MCHFAGVPFGNVRFSGPDVLPLGLSLHIPQDVCTQIITAMSPTPKTKVWDSRQCNLPIPHTPLHGTPNKNPRSRWHQTLSLCVMAFLQLLGTVTEIVHCSPKPAWYSSCLVLFQGRLSGSPDRPWPLCLAENDLRFLILLLFFPQCWDYRCKWPHPVYVVLGLGLR